MGQNFQEMTRDIISHPLFLQLKDCPHHGGENSLYIHSIDTAKCAYRWPGGSIFGRSGCGP